MKKAQFIRILVLFSLLCLGAEAQETNEITPMLSTEPESTEAVQKVTAVYGVTADDYLPPPVQETARRHLRPEVRKSSTRPSFDLPDAFYFVGGPIFLLLFLRVLVTFLNGFEEKRKEEQRQVASQNANPE